MSNSPLVQYTRISPNSNNPRNHKIDKITIHHTAGVVSVETLGNIFASPERYASSNYGIGSDGRIAMFVEEKNRSWCSSSWDNDQRAITIEVSNSSTGGNWPVSDYVLSRLIDLCVDICKRNDIKKLNFTGDANGNLTMHRYFANTSCPGDYLASKFPYIASEVNKRLEKVELKIEEIEKKKVKLNCDANLWNLNFHTYGEAKPVKQFKNGDIIENIVAIVNHPVGSKYYLTEYSYNNGIMNGFNVVDCDDIADEPPKHSDVVETPKDIEEDINKDLQDNTEKESQQIDNADTEKQDEIKEKFYTNLIKMIIELLKKIFNKKQD